MARGLKSKQGREYESSDYIPRRSLDSILSSSSGTAGTGTVGEPKGYKDFGNKPGWEMRLTLGQLVVLWSVVGGTLIMSFLFGLYAGREQGIELALGGRSGEAIRLPVASPVAALDSPISAVEPGAAPLGGEVAPVSPEAAVSSDLESNKRQGSGSPNVVSPPAQVSSTTDQAGGLPLAGPENSAASSAELKAGVEARAQSVPLVPEKELQKERSSTVIETVAARAGVAGDREREKKSEEKGERGIKTGKLEERAPAIRTLKSSAVSPGWYLQIAAARSNREAGIIVRRLQSAGITPMVETADVGKSTYFRVILGPYGSRDAAQAAKKGVIATKAAKGEPFLKQVK